MIPKEIIEDIPIDGVLKLRVPEFGGQKVKILFFPFDGKADKQDHLDFLAATYLAAVEDDEEEDAIWENKGAIEG